jgi:TldD protein
LIPELEALTALGGEMSRRARSAGMLLIARAQCRTARGVMVRRGKVEGASISSSGGQGLHVVTPEGRTALASRDDFRPDETLLLLGRVIETAGQSAGLRITTGELPSLRPLQGRELAADSEAFSKIRLDEVGRRLVELEAEILSRVPGVQLSVSFHAEVEAWRIFRSDGTDVLFSIPRCTLGAHATSGGDGARHGVSTSLFHTRPDVLSIDSSVDTFMKKAESAARLARDLPDAPNHPAGSYPLVIDYALAKGLAHEAFGHAAEADGYRSSVLARDGRFRRGEQVGAGHVSIIDEPVPGDHAWQPFSANGLPRERVVLVDHGRLSEGLSDPWSAGPGGVRLSGAARAQSYRRAPQPRMTNIRIEVDRPLAAPGAFEDYGPEKVRQLLLESGVFERHPRVVFLSGYSGGQVNPTTGDFVFNCKAIYALGSDGIDFHKPAIFSGSMFGALDSVREAFGPLKLDAIGHCGKWGQQVPSSGGSHYFLVIDPHPDVRLGGS